MDVNPSRRKTLRLPDFGYTDGAFFVTLVANGRRCLFGDIVDGALRPSSLGLIAADQWETTAQIRCEVSLGAFVLMPNHIHGIVVIDGWPGRPPVAPTKHRSGPIKKSLGALIAGYKSAVTRAAREASIAVPGGPIWQRNYYEHIIRDERDWNAVVDYIEDNPRAWAEDSENPFR